MLETLYDHELIEDRLGLLINRQCNLTDMLIQQNEQSLLPRLYLPMFVGDPIEYTTFIQVFDMQFGRSLSQILIVYVTWISIWRAKRNN